MKKVKHDIGVIYLAFGYDYLLMAINSALSIKQIHKDLNISIVTNVKINEGSNKKILYETHGIESEIFDNIIYVDESRDQNRNHKTSVIDYTPYDRTLYLDCDTEVQNGIISGFEFLDYFDIAFVSRPIPSYSMTNKWNGDIHLKNIPIEDIATFHGGVFFFDKKNSKSFFDTWNNKYHEFGYNYDQYSLVHAIYKSDVRLLPLPIKWDVNDDDLNKFEGFYDNYQFYDSIKIRHKNRHTRTRTKMLRKIDRDIGKKLIASHQNQKQKMRKEFKSEYNIVKDICRSEPVRGIKRTAARSNIIKTLYRNITK